MKFRDTKWGKPSNMLPYEDHIVNHIMRRRIYECACVCVASCEWTLTLLHSSVDVCMSEASNAVYGSRDIVVWVSVVHNKRRNRVLGNKPNACMRHFVWHFLAQTYIDLVCFWKSSLQIDAKRHFIHTQSKRQRQQNSLSQNQLY